MLRIETEVKTSSRPELGLGLFTLQDIREGDVIWRFDPGVDVKMSITHAKTLSEPQCNYINKYAWRQDSLLYLSVDNERFINHSYTPNVRCVMTESVTYAARDIKAGEELFTDYSTFDDDFDSYSSTLI